MSIVVDVHTHMVTQDYLALLREKGAPKYTFRTLPSGGEVIDKSGTPFFTLLPDMWNFPARIKAMDAAKVDVAVVSLTSPNAYLGDVGNQCPGRKADERCLCRCPAHLAGSYPMVCLVAVAAC